MKQKLEILVGGSIFLFGVGVAILVVAVVKDIAGY